MDECFERGADESPFFCFGKDVNSGVSGAVLGVERTPSAGFAHDKDGEFA